MELSIKNLEISEAVIEFFTSCLLANIKTAAFRKSWGRKRSA